MSKTGGRFRGKFGAWYISWAIPLYLGMLHELSEKGVVCNIVYPVMGVCLGQCIIVYTKVAVDALKSAHCAKYNPAKDKNG